MIYKWGFTLTLFEKISIYVGNTKNYDTYKGYDTNEKDIIM